MVREIIEDCYESLASNFGNRVTGSATRGDVRRWHVGKLDMLAFLNSSNVDGTIFEPLRDPAVFAEARVVMGAVQWPNGADLAPDAMYDAIHESGVWVLD